MAIHHDLHDEQLDDRIDRLLLVVEAMWGLLREHTGLADEELFRRIEAVDLEDGVSDRRRRNQSSQWSPASTAWTRSPKWLARASRRARLRVAKRRRVRRTAASYDVPGTAAERRSQCLEEPKKPSVAFYRSWS